MIREMTSQRDYSTHVQGFIMTRFLKNPCYYTCGFHLLRSCNGTVRRHCYNGGQCEEKLFVPEKACPRFPLAKPRSSLRARARNCSRVQRLLTHSLNCLIT